MKYGKKLLAAVLMLAVCVTVLLPMRAGAAEVCFTAINDNVLKLTSEMPVWSDGTLYAPYTTFDGTANGMRWNVECSYSKSTGVITVFDMDKRQFLEFDLREGTCQDSLTGETYEPGAILRGSQPYLPVKVVCSYFGLRYTYREIDQGNLLRIKNEDVVLSDSDFVDAATNVLNLRLREYNKAESGETAATAPAVPSTSTTPQEQPKDEVSVATYLAFRCEDQELTQGLLMTLEHQGVRAMCFVTPELAAQRGDLILWMLGAGHSVGLLAEGESLEQTRALLVEGSRALEEQAFLRTTVALTGEEYRETLEQEGWVCWNSTLELSPKDSDGPSYFSRRVINQLGGRTSAVYLSLDASVDTLRVLPTLLNRLGEAGYTLNLPLETHI